jgi:hypothetical protein
MKGQTGNRGITAIFTAALVGALFMGGVGGYAVAKAEGTGSTSSQQVIAIASRWDHEEQLVSDTTTPRALRWDHEERALDTTTTPRASRWDHEER